MAAPARAKRVARKETMFAVITKCSFLIDVVKVIECDNKSRKCFAIWKDKEVARNVSDVW